MWCRRLWASLHKQDLKGPLGLFGMCTGKHIPPVVSDMSNTELTCPEKQETYICNNHRIILYVFLKSKCRLVNQTWWPLGTDLWVLLLSWDAMCSCRYIQAASPRPFLLAKTFAKGFPSQTVLWVTTMLWLAQGAHKVYCAREASQDLSCALITHWLLVWCRF